MLINHWPLKHANRKSTQGWCSWICNDALFWWYSSFEGIVLESNGCLGPLEGQQGEHRRALVWRNKGSKWKDGGWGVGVCQVRTRKESWRGGEDSLGKRMKSLDGVISLWKCLCTWVDGGRAFFSSSLCCLGSVFQSLWFLGHQGHSLLVAYPRLMASFTETYRGPAPVGSRDSLRRTALAKG